MSDPIKLSYSGVSRFKTCPQKYYLAKDWKETTSPAAFPFGNAIEEGVTEYIKTKDYEKAVSKFYWYWKYDRGLEENPVFGNLEIQYNKTDFDSALVEARANYEAENYLEEFIEDNPNLSNSSWMGLMASLQESVQAKTELSESELLFHNKMCWLSMLEKGKIMLEAFGRDILDEIEDIVQIDGKDAFQHEISMSNEEGDALTGFIDWILYFKGVEKPVITDGKTSSNPDLYYTDHTIQTSEQLRTYATAMKAKYNEDFSVAYLVLGKKIKKKVSCSQCGEEFSSRRKRPCGECGGEVQTNVTVDTKLLFADYSQDLLEQELDDYENVLTSIKNDVIFRNTEACMKFNRPCEFYDICWKGKSPEEIEYLTKKVKKEK